jgi:hypothetical protein
VNRTFGGDNLQEKKRTMEQQLVESREKGNFLHMKNQVSFSFSIPSVSAKSANMPILPPNPVLAKQFKEELIRLSLTSVTMKGVSIKMEMKKGTRVNKAMKMFRRRFKVPWTDLKYFMGNTERIGMELADGFDGIDIKVYGPA